jgi:periplasmic divalent cation tolerance protein
MNTNTSTLLVLTTLPDHDAALALAGELVRKRLAACVNLLAPCASVFRWQDKVEIACEVPMLLKTTAERYPALESALRAAHPYGLPELIALPVTHGLAAYLDWVAASTAPDGDGDGAPRKKPRWSWRGKENL